MSDSLYDYDSTHQIPWNLYKAFCVPYDVLLLYSDSLNTLLSLESNLLRKLMVNKADFTQRKIVVIKKATNRGIPTRAKRKGAISKVMLKTFTYKAILESGIRTTKAFG